MKKSLPLIILILATSLSLLGQTENNSKKSYFIKSADLYSNLDITAGYVPKSFYNALKVNISVNNILLKRIGLYTSLEKGFDSEYMANTVGITTSVHKYAYLWGGIGLFGENGIFNATDSKFRKEFGIGIMPYRLTLVRVGWSIQVGPSITVGMKIPIEKHQNKN